MNSSKAEPRRSPLFQVEEILTSILQISDSSEFMNSRKSPMSTSAIRIISVFGVASAFIPLVGKEKSQGVNTAD